MNGISFQVQAGETFGMLGPNGAGKTTTIEIVDGLRQLDGGAGMRSRPFHFRMAFGGMESGKYKVGLVVEDKSSLGQGLTQALGGVRVFGLVSADREKELEALRKGDRRAVILIPEGITAAASAGKSNLEVYYDATNSVASQTILGIMRQVVSEMDRERAG